MKLVYVTFLLLIPALFITGCESNDESVFGDIEVTPASTSLTGDERSVTLTADVSTGNDGSEPEPIVYPLTWSVADSSLGTIISQAANKAVYKHTASTSGSNVIIVRDNLNREGLATVSWVSTNAIQEGLVTLYQ